MSIAQPTFHDLHTAGLYGMGTIQGDPEMLQELGIPVTDEDLARAVESGNQVSTTIEKNAKITPEVASAIGSIMCGDCLIEIVPGKTCIGGHITNPLRGNARING